MGRFRIVASVLAFAAIGCAEAAAQQGASPQRGPAPQQRPAGTLSVEPPLVDFGVVAPSTKHPARFTLRNTGASPVTITKAQPSCKCTDVSDIAGRTLGPGESVELTAALSVPASPGIKDARVMIAVQGQPGLVEARMQADVTFPVRVEPAYVDALKGATEREIAVSSVDGKPFRITAAGGRPPRFVGHDPSKDPPAASYRLSWRLQDMAPGQLPLWWVVDTDRPDCPQVPLRVRHETTGSRFDPERNARFWFVPESIMLAGTVRPGTPVELKVSIEHLNPAAQGRVTNPAWSDVRGISVPGGEGTAELVSAARRGSDFVDITFRLTPAAGRSGPMYFPVVIETATGRGPAFVAATAVP
jgi:hypothetical protein